MAPKNLVPNAMAQKDPTMPPVGPRDISRGQDSYGELPCPPPGVRRPGITAGTAASPRAEIMKSAPKALPRSNGVYSSAMMACTQGSTSASPMPDRAAQTEACAGTHAVRFSCLLLCLTERTSVGEERSSKLHCKAAAPV